MAALVCLLTLFLALPILNFVSLSLNNQISRLNNGAIQADEFDYAALAFDFGELGRKALEAMQGSDNQAQVNRATLALAANSKWDLDRSKEREKSAKVLESKLVIYPRPVSLPDELKAAINERAACAESYCLLIWEANSETARLLTSPPQCSNFRQQYSSDYFEADEYHYCSPTVTVLDKIEDAWLVKGRFNRLTDEASQAQKQAEQKTISNAIEQGDIEIRTIEYQQIFIGDKPVGLPYAAEPKQSRGLEQGNEQPETNE